MTPDELRADAATVVWHVGRSWTGTAIEDVCPCPKTPCGLVVDLNPDCDQHRGNRTTRQGHPADRCPGSRAEAPHHAAARQRSDDEEKRISDWLAPLKPKLDGEAQGRAERTVELFRADAPGGAL